MSEASTIINQPIVETPGSPEASPHPAEVAQHIGAAAVIAPDKARSRGAEVLAAWSFTTPDGTELGASDLVPHSSWI